MLNGGGSFQVEGIASAKALWQEHACYYLGTTKCQCGWSSTSKERVLHREWKEAQIMYSIAGFFVGPWLLV